MALPAMPIAKKRVMTCDSKLSRDISRKAPMPQIADVTTSVTQYTPSQRAGVRLCGALRW
ncbi:hypothetical protein GCM10007363_18350 [Pseudomonas fluvialis]|uniref:Uncharacterized protein n=1 Tax=Pseudomonas fluvialis TaxID=1793966 RepID=A0ABQ2ALH0_9PSED|nr:hypothetical protein GCM10007363_18350 [Pseudomonas fluvialis]